MIRRERPGCGVFVGGAASAGRRLGPAGGYLWCVSRAWLLGFYPFLIGDILKMVLVGSSLPGVFRRSDAPAAKVAFSTRVKGRASEAWPV